MFVATVEFSIDPAHAGDFMSAMHRQAANSLELEPGCVRFDVCRNPKDPTRVFLYEVYVDEAAFELHLQSAHFLEFDRHVRPWVRDRRVTRWDRVES